MTTFNFKQTINHRIINRYKFIPLRYRFILMTSLMLLMLLSILASVLIVLQSRTIRNRIEIQGLSMANNLAAVSIDHLLTYNYIALEKLANLAANNPDILYIIIHTKEGRVAGFSKRPELQNKMLTDLISQNAFQSDTPVIAEFLPANGKNKAMDISVPVYLPGTKDRWGTIRVCLSLELMYQQIRQTLVSILILGILSLVFGILLSNWAAQRVTRPLEHLVQATKKASEGDFKQNLLIESRDEVEILAANFSDMVIKILAQKEQLELQLHEIKRLQHYSGQLLATMHDGLLAVDLNGMVTAVNPAAYSILEFPNSLSVDHIPVTALFEENNPLLDYIRYAIKNPLNLNQREIQVQQSDHTKTILIGASVLEADTTDHQQLIFNFNDITELKKLEAKMRQTQRLADIGTLAAGMAHEIRNPLSAIKTYVALLSQKIDKPGFLDKFHRTVPREINRLNTLTEELLELSRPPKFNFQPTQVRHLLDQCLELMEKELHTRKIDCSIQAVPDLPRIMADPEQLKRVFINLFKNSIQAMPDGGKIVINIRLEHSFLAIIFSDTGIGFSPELAKNLFNPFFTTKAKGTGLGLAISHKIISEHLGQMEARSQEGKGSSFSISLPIKQ